MRVFIIAIWILVSLPAFSQADFIKLVNDYYRVDPFKGTFSAFYNLMKSDRFLLNKEFNRSENGESLDISGAYKIFNPFSINASNIHVSLKNEGTIIYYSIPVAVYAYEMTGTFADSRYARRKIRNDIWFIANRMRRLYLNSKSKTLRKRDIIDAKDAIRFWFRNLTLFKAAEVSWSPLINSGELELKLKCYFVVINNYAYPLGHYPGRTSDQFNDLGSWRRY